MFARTVKFMLLVVLFVSSLMANVAVPLPKGWGPWRLLAQHSGKGSDFLKCRYEYKGQDITDEVINPKTGKATAKADNLWFGTVVLIPEELDKKTEAVDPQGKTFGQICQENSFSKTECVKLEIANHISSLHRPLTSEIRIPAKPVQGFDLPHYKTPDAGITADSIGKNLQTVLSSRQILLIMGLLLTMLALLVIFRKILARLVRDKLYRPIANTKFGRLLMRQLHLPALNNIFHNIWRNEKFSAFIKFFHVPTYTNKMRDLWSRPWYRAKQRRELYNIAQACAKSFKDHQDSSQIFPELYIQRCKLRVFRSCCIWEIAANLEKYPERFIGVLQVKANDVAAVALESIGQTNNICFRTELKPHRILIRLRFQEEEKKQWRIKRSLRAIRTFDIW